MSDGDKKDPDDALRDELGDVHFGQAKDRPPNWRDVKDDDEDGGDEDKPTPPEVVAMLGFDPADEPDDGSQDA